MLRTEIIYEEDNYYTYHNVHASFMFFRRYEKQLLDLQRFGYGSLYNTAMQWLQSGKKESVDEIAQMFYRECAS